MFDVGDADKGDQCWRMLDLPDERDALTPLPAPAASDEPTHQIEEARPAPETTDTKHDRLARFSQFLASGRPLDEWTEWTD